MRMATISKRSNRDYVRHLETIERLLEEGGGGGGGSATDAVKYTPQSLTSAQKDQARENIGTVSTADLAEIASDISGIEVSIESLEAAVEAINVGDYITATTLPTASASTMGHIYLIGPDTNNNYDRYFTQESNGSYSWASLGSTQIDLSTYATQEEVSQLEAEVTNNTDNINNLQSEIDAINPIVIEGDVTNAPDEEDITTDTNDLLKFANRAPGVNYKGVVILRKNKTFEEQVAQTNTIYEIRYSFVLTDDFQIPAGCVLDFRGGSIDGAFTLDLNDCQIIGSGGWIGASLNVSGAAKNTYHIGWFGGNLGKAISCVPARATIIGGPLTISNTISISRSDLREVILDGFNFTLNADLFTTSAQYIQIPSFINCHFDGNGYAIFGGEYCIGGQIINCVFRETSLISGTTKTLQSLYANGCSVKNDSVTFIKARRVYDCHISNFTCEGQSATFMDTHDSDFSTGGTQQLWVNDSIFEGFTAIVFKLSGGNIRFTNCYFEANTAGVCSITKNASGANLLFVGISKCNVVSPVTAFTISGYTATDRVVVSVRDNNYNSGVANTYLITGVPGINYATFENNKIGTSGDRICDSGVNYLDYSLTQPTYNTTYFSHFSGGFVRLGKLCVAEFRTKAVRAISSSLTGAMTGLPRPITAQDTYLLDGNNVTTIKASLNGSGQIGITGATELNKIYTIRMYYFTNDTREI